MLEIKNRHLTWGGPWCEPLNFEKSKIMEKFILVNSGNNLFPRFYRLIIREDDQAQNQIEAVRQ